MDYSRIKEEFKKMGKEFTLSEEECVGLTESEKAEINPCGTYCGACEDYEVVCDGCRNRQGRPIWYDMYSKEKPCKHYTCAEERGCHDCSQCDKLPCDEYFIYPDPNMPDDIKQMWFKLRMENFNKLTPDRQLEILPSFKENEDKYNK